MAMEAAMAAVAMEAVTLAVMAQDRCKKAEINYKATPPH